MMPVKTRSELMCMILAIIVLVIEANSTTNRIYIDGQMITFEQQANFQFASCLVSRFCTPRRRRYVQRSRRGSVTKLHLLEENFVRLKKRISKPSPSARAVHAPFNNQPPYPDSSTETIDLCVNIDCDESLQPETFLLSVYLQSKNSV